MGAGSLPQKLTLEVSMDGQKFEARVVDTGDFGNALRQLGENYPFLRLPADHVDQPYTLSLSNLLVDEGFRFAGGSEYRRD